MPRRLVRIPVERIPYSGCSLEECGALRKVGLAGQSDCLNRCLPGLLQPAFVSRYQRLEMFGVAMRQSRGDLRGSLVHCAPVPIQERDKELQRESVFRCAFSLGGALED